MKSPVYLALATLAAIATATLVACGGSAKSNSNGVVPTGQTCPAGTVYIAQYNGCFSTAQCATYGANYGYVPQVNQCVPGVPGGSVPPFGGGTWTGRTWTGSINITNHGVYRQLLKDWGVCDFAWASFGSWDCNAWDNVAAVQMELASTNLPTQGAVSIIAYMNWGGYDQRLLPYSGQVSPINNNTGLELRATGPVYGFNKIFSAVGDKGVLVVNNQVVNGIRLTLTYNGVQFGYADTALRW